jgi:hypothetical protein
VPKRGRSYLGGKQFAETGFDGVEEWYFSPIYNKNETEWRRSDVFRPLRSEARGGLSDQSESKGVEHELHANCTCVLPYSENKLRI